MRLPTLIDTLSRDDAALGDIARARGGVWTGAADAALGRAVVRHEVYRSWLRSRALGVRPEADNPAHVDAAHRGGRLLESVRPVLETTGGQLAGTDAWLTVIDHEGVQLSPTIGAPSGPLARAGVGAILTEATVGTSGPSSALESMSPFAVVGTEHYLDAASQETTVGVPVRDLTNRIVAVVAAGAPLTRSSGLLLSFASAVAAQIGERLIASAVHEDSEMLRLFRGATRRDSQATVLVSDRVVIVNTAARQLLLTRNQPESIIAQVAQAAGDAEISELPIDDQVPLTVRVERVEGIAGSVVGMATFRQRSAPPIRDILSEPVERLRRAREMGARTLVYGEPGSGRFTLIRDALGSGEKVWTTDARLLRLDADEWWHDLREACARERVVIVRHLDEVPNDARCLMAAIVQGATAWCAMTSSVSPGPRNPLFGMFSVVVERTPLRERRAEFGEIVPRMLRELGLPRARYRPEVLTVFARHAWPGNLVQLRRVLAGTASRSPEGEIAVEYLPTPVIAAATATVATDRARRSHEELFRALSAANWNRDEAALRLGISRATLYRRIRQLGITVPNRRGHASQSETLGQDEPE